MLPQQWLTTHETRQREAYGTEGGEKQNERQSAKPIKFSTSARRKRKKKSEGDRAQQEDREMSWGVLPLKLNYSEVTVDEPTIQKKRERRRDREKRTFLFLSAIIHKTSGVLTWHFSPSPLSLLPSSISVSLNIPAMNNP